MEWVTGIGIVVLIVVLGGGLLYGVWWIVRREARQEARGRKWEDDQMTAEEAVDKAVSKGFSIPKLMVVIAIAAIVIMGILSRTQG